MADEACPNGCNLDHFGTHHGGCPREPNCRTVTTAVPDPRFRDQLAEWVRWVNSPMAEPWHRDLIAGTTARHAAELRAWAERLAHTYSRSGTLEVTAVVWALLDALDAAEARVQAAANQRAAEVGEAVYRFGRALAEVNPDALTYDAARLNRIALDAHADLVRALWGPAAAALASPAPAPRAEAGQ